MITNQSHIFYLDKYTKISFEENFTAVSYEDNVIVEYSSPEIVFIHNKIKKRIKVKPNTTLELNDITWKCCSPFQTCVDWGSQISNNVISPTFYDDNNVVFNIPTNHTDYKTLSNDELTLRIFLKYFHRELYKNLFENKEIQLAFIINDNIQETFFNIFKVLILRFLGESFISISDQTSLDCKLTNLDIPKTEPYYSEISQIVYEIQQKNTSFFSNGKDFIGYQHCINSESKILAKDNFQKAVELFNEIK